MLHSYQLIQGLLLPFLFGVGSCSDKIIKAPEHLNIIVIMTDKQSASMMSCTGNRWLKTPAMDNIALNGIRFTGAYATNPVSAFSSISLQTGRYPSEIGMRENSCVGIAKDKVIGLYTNAMGNVFRKGGYQTYYGGKVHMPVIGSDVSILGYDLLTLDERDSLAAICADFLLNRKEENKPFLLFAYFINPHDICYDAIRWATPGGDLANATPPELDEALKLLGISSSFCPPLPDNHQPMAGELSSVDSLLKLRIFRQNVRAKWTEKDWRMYRWAYMRLTERVVAQIGIVMEVLSKSGLSENTMVLFTSDHGDLDDSHKLEHKTILYEEATNVPFIILYPWMKKKGIVDNEHLISNGLCLMPTLCEVAGIEASSGLAGSSVLSLIEQNRNTAWTKNIFLETETGYIIHTGRFKYELDDIGKIKGMPVDLKNDGETENLINRVEYKPVIDSLRYELINHLKGEGVRIPALASQ